MDHGIHPLHRGCQRLAVEYLPTTISPSVPSTGTTSRKRIAWCPIKSTPSPMRPTLPAAPVINTLHPPPSRRHDRRPGKPIAVRGFSSRNSLPGCLESGGTRPAHRGGGSRSGAKTAYQRGGGQSGRRRACSPAPFHGREELGPRVRKGKAGRLGRKGGACPAGSRGKDAQTPDHGPSGRPEACPGEHPAAFRKAIAINRLHPSWMCGARATVTSVVIPDERVDRTTDGTGPRADLLLAELRQLDAGSGSRRSMLGEQIPTFPEGDCRNRAPPSLSHGDQGAAGPHRGAGVGHAQGSWRWAHGDH